MSVKAINWFLYGIDAERFTSVTAYRTLGALADYADPDGRNAFPGQKTLAKRLGCSERTIRRCLTWLESNGYIMKGNQNAASELPVGHRTTVWDLRISREDNPVRPRRTVRRPDNPVRPRPDNRADNRADIRADNCCPPIVNNINDSKERGAREAKPIGDWKPTPEHRALAARLNLDCEAEAAKFTDQALDQGTLSADWDARFRNWLRRGHELGITNTNTTGTGNSHQHTWKCRHTLQLLHRSEPDAICDALACTVASALNDGIDPDRIARTVRDGDTGRLQDLTWEPA